MRAISMRLAVLAVLVVVASVFGATGVIATTSVGDIPDPGHPSGRSPKLPYAGHAVPVLVPAPSTVINEQNTSNTEIKVFAEQEDVVLAAGVSYDQLLTLTDSGVISAGTTVSSYFIHLDNVGTTQGVRGLGFVAFDTEILGLITSDASLAASDVPLGSPTTSYPTTLTNRGLEQGTAWTLQDIIWVSGDKKTLYLDLQVFNVLDHMRVIIEGTTDINVDIDIKPGSDPNCFNVNGHGVIPVAINGSMDFDVSMVDVSTLSLAGLDVRVKGNGAAQCSIQDWNDDGYDDLVCQFVDDADAWSPDNGTATLTGNLSDGTPIEGTDDICVVP